LEACRSIYVNRLHAKPPTRRLAAGNLQLRVLDFGSYRHLPAKDIDFGRFGCRVSRTVSAVRALLNGAQTSGKFWAVRLFSCGPIVSK
jgi:hypothetical protein